MVVDLIDAFSVKSSRLELPVQLERRVTYAGVLYILAMDNSSILLLIINKSLEISEDQNFEVKTEPQLKCHTIISMIIFVRLRVLIIT